MASPAKFRPSRGHRPAASTSQGVEAERVASTLSRVIWAGSDRRRARRPTRHLADVQLLAELQEPQYVRPAEQAHDLSGSEDWAMVERTLYQELQRPVQVVVGRDRLEGRGGHDRSHGRG